MKLTIENIAPGVWGVWTGEGRMIGSLRRYRRDGVTYWNVDHEPYGRTIEWFWSFRTARDFARNHWGGWA